MYLYLNAFDNGEYQGRGKGRGEDKCPSLLNKLSVGYMLIPAQSSNIPQQVNPSVNPAWEISRMCSSDRTTTYTS